MGWTQFIRVEVFYAKNLEKIYLEILSEHRIQYESHTSRFASLLVSNNDDFEKRNIGSKITICFTACADTVFEDMDPGTIIRSMRDVRPLHKLMAGKKNSFNGTFDIDCELKSIPIQLLTLVNMLINGRACTRVSQASLSIAQLIFSNFKQAPGCNAAAFRRDNLDHETPLKLFNSLKMISDKRSTKLVENSHSLGLGASCSRARNVMKDLSKLSIYQYHINGVFTPRSLKKNVFTIIAKDNIDKNARSNTASSLTIMGLARLLCSCPWQTFQLIIWQSIPSTRRMAMILRQYHRLVASFHKFIILRNLFILKFSLFKELSMDWQRLLSKSSLKSIGGWRL